MSKVTLHLLNGANYGDLSLWLSIEFARIFGIGEACDALNLTCWKH